LRAESQRGGAEPLQLITVSDRRAPSAPSRRAWWVVPLLLAGMAGGFVAGRTTAPTKQVIVTVTLPATTAQPTSTARSTFAPTTLAPSTAPVPVTTAVAPAPTTAAAPATTVAALPETTAPAAPTEPPAPAP
jgi:hypothetical protein